MADQPPALPSVNMSRLVRAPRARVFAAWTDPALLPHWWGPHGFTVPRCAIDARPGGAVSIDMQAPDGAVFTCAGTFREFVQDARLVTHFRLPGPDGQVAAEVLNTVTFADAPGGTQVTVDARVVWCRPGAEGIYEGMEQGWAETLERLAAAPL